MAAIVPILKALLPHVTQIAAIAIPAFTKKTNTTTVDPVVAKQIEELQLAATNNAQSIQSLADKLTLTLQSIEDSAQKLERDLQRMRTQLLIAWMISGVAILTACIALFR